ncbi:uncharacterized protein LOC131947353 [Physella acuta]|uniref:uncharacterized protein LOC131947353 n=1 Tax=Physella acuta TaxID=109671 RepID=UPI0027DDCBC9|nr:uncharacterized protein LOC131947353 [Physella acuta]
MPSRIQVKLVTEHKKYLEQQIQLLEPVIGDMKNVVAKSKAWLEEKTDQSSVSYIELSQELDTAATALLDVTSHILNEDNLDVNKPTPSLPQPDTQTTATFLTVESTRQLITQVQHTAVEEHPDLERRLAYIETTLSSLQDTQHKSTDDISEIKQWRDNFVTEQSDMGVNIEQLTKKQKQNVKNLRKQMSEQDNKVKELNKEIESLKEKESNSNKTLEKLSLDMKENENNLHKISKEMQDHRDKTDIIAHTIKRHSNLICSLQEELKNNEAYTDKSNDILAKIGIIEKDILTLVTDFKLLETRVCQHYTCQIHLENDTPVTTGLIISTFSVLREHNGNHFNETTGKLEAPDDGLYLVIVTLVAGGNNPILVKVAVGELKYKTIYVKPDNISACGSTVVPLKKGQELYFKVQQSGPGSFLQKGSGFTILRI